MIWKDGVPKAEGVDDWRDSAVLAGLLKAIDPWENIKLSSYLDSHGNVLRCPDDDPCDTSRDNTIPIFAAAHLTNCTPLVHKAIDRVLETSLFQNGDICGPAQRAFLMKIRFYEEPTFFQTVALWLDVFLMSIRDKTVETNQFILMYLCMDRKYLRFYTRMNINWRDPLRYYWDSWRKEPTLAEELIKVLEKFTGVSAYK
jgi:hypothetical protein